MSKTEQLGGELVLQLAWRSYGCARMQVWALYLLVVVGWIIFYLYVAKPACSLPFATSLAKPHSKLRSSGVFVGKVLPVGPMRPWSQLQSSALASNLAAQGHLLGTRLSLCELGIRRTASRATADKYDSNTL
eukprot:3722272-Amphidinium_carterae.3